MNKQMSRGNIYNNEVVSVIMPVYNSEKFIKKSMKSVLNQTYKNWELIIVDDCSTDNTAEEIKSVMNEKIKYYRLEENSGAAVARNKAIEVASGRYIAFLDADDMWEKEKLKEQIEFMNKNSVGFSCTNYEIMGLKKVVKVPKKINYNYFMKNTIIGTLTVVIDRNIIGDFRIVDVRKDHDSMTWAKLLRKGYCAYGLDRNLAYYRKVEGSISNNKVKAAKNHWMNLRNIENLSLLKSAYYFLFYALNAIKKHYF